MLVKITDYLKKKQWAYTNGGKEESLFFSVTGTNGIYHCLVDFSESSLLFAFITYMGTNCPIEKRMEMAALLNTINSTLLYGNFEMNSAGDIKYRTSLYYDDTELTEKVIDNIIIKNIYNLDFTAPYLSKFMFGNLTIEDVYNSIFPPNAQVIEDTPQAEVSET